jgi:succinate dehydrogenase / fumarate reductase membrane anchor subunit
MQRLTAVANIPLVIVLMVVLAGLVGADHATAKATLAAPYVSIPMLLLILSGVYHMRLGMQTFIEDYFSSEGLRVVALMLNTFFAFLVGLTSVFAVLKISFGA